MIRRLIVLAFFLSACGAPTPTAGPPSPTAGADLTQAPAATATAASSAATPSVTPLPPTPTPDPVTVAYVAGNAGTPGVLEAAQQAAQANGWVLETASDPSEAGLRALVEAGADVVIADGPELEAATRAAAQAFPAAYFVGVQHGAGESELPNLLALGGGVGREDQLGFMAGTVAGLLTEGRIVTVLSTTGDAAGLKYRNGFLHGVRYVCSRCRVDFINLADPAATAFAAEQARMHATLSSDVLFAAPGAAGQEGLLAAAQAGAWVIGAGSDAYVQVFGNGSAQGADRVITSAYFDYAALVANALTAYQAGTPLAGAQPLSAASGALALAPYRVSDEVLSELDRQEISRTLERLASGALETGVDPETGNEL